MRYESSYVQYYGVDPYNPGNTAKQHGIIGMKWGKWNEETRARYLGLNKRKNKTDGETTKRKDLSSLSENEKKKIDKKYIKEYSYTIKTRMLDDNGHYTDKWVTEKRKYDGIDAKKIIKDLDNNFYEKIDAEKKEFNAYEKKHSYEKKWVAALDAYWYGHDFSLNMFPVYMTENEFKKDMKDYWAQGMSDSDIDAIYKYMVEKTKYADKVESICNDEAKKLGISDSMLNIAAQDLYSVFVDSSKDTKSQAKEIRHSDHSGNSYYGSEPYNPYTTAKQHGIMGQKWGVWNEETRRRYLGGGSKSKWFKNPFKSNKAEEDSHLKRTHLRNDLADISDAELKAAVERMRLEQTYLDYLAKYPDASDRGRKYANQFSDELFKNLSTGLGGAMGKKIAQAIDDWINNDESEDAKYRAEAEQLFKEGKLKDVNAKDAMMDQYVKNQKKKNA